MKKFRFLLPIAVAIILTITGCANDSTTKSTTEDSIKKDTINRNSENFSAPH